MGELPIPSPQALQTAALAAATRIPTGADDIVLRRALPIDHDQASAWAATRMQEVRKGTDQLARLGLLTGILAAGDLEVHGRGLGLFYQVVALASLCWVSGPTLRDESTGLPVLVDPDGVQALLLAYPSIYRHVSDWAWGEPADWSSEGNGSGLPSGASGPAAHFPPSPIPATPEPGSGV